MLCRTEAAHDQRGLSRPVLDLTRAVQCAELGPPCGPCPLIFTALGDTHLDKAGLRWLQLLMGSWPLYTTHAQH